MGSIVGMGGMDDMGGIVGMGGIDGMGGTDDIAVHDFDDGFHETHKALKWEQRKMLRAGS